MTTSPPQGDPPARRWTALDAPQRRVLGVLIEKAKTTPGGYPMSANAVVTGCNQRNNRDPVTAYDDFDVEKVLSELQTLGVVKEIDWVGRVAKYKHVAYEWLGVRPVELAVLAELLLRGAQALGELRARASRMEPIADLVALKPIVEGLVARHLMIELTPPGRGQIVSHNLYPPDELASLRAQHGGGGAGRVEPAPAAPETRGVAVIPMADLTPAGSTSATFQGSEHGASVSFFVVSMTRGQGPRKHRHAHEETFIVLEGEIQVTADGTSRTLGGGTIVVIPRGTWHEFTVLSETARMVNVHPVPKIITEWAD